jgi:hypothetical protein
VLADRFREEELSGQPDPRVPHLVGALDIARGEVRSALAELDALRERLGTLAVGIDQALA